MEILASGCLWQILAGVWCESKTFAQLQSTARMKLFRRGGLAPWQVAPVHAHGPTNLCEPPRTPLQFGALHLGAQAVAPFTWAYSLPPGFCSVALAQ